jgi:protein-disulfide isomerase
MTITASTILTVPVTSRDHFRGPDSGEVTLVEYGDYACPRCNQARPVVRRLYGAIGERFNHDMSNHTHALRVRQDVIAANRSGVSDTPSFFINDRRHLGPSDFETLLSSIGEAS